MPGNGKSEKPQRSTNSTGSSLKSIPGNPISSRTRSARASSSPTDNLKPYSATKRTIQSVSKSAGRRSTVKGKFTKSGGKSPTATISFPQSVHTSSADLGSAGTTSGHSNTSTTESQHSAKQLGTETMTRWGNHFSSSNLLHDNDEPMPLAPTDKHKDADLCVVCMCPPDKPKKLEKCGHIFCGSCIDQCFSKMNPVCPICGTVYGQMEGNMPSGTMKHYVDQYTQLPGYSGCCSIVIEYDFPNGTQTPEHPHPGRMYHGTRRVAYLPDNTEGRKVLKLLRKAFDRRMTFTVGRSATTGLDDQVIWNDVHHKTRVNGGPTSFGYPDATYLRRVQEELAVKGITEH